MANVTTSCKECGQNYLQSPNEEQWEKKLATKLPNLCFECSHRQRLSLRTDRVLYNRKCDFSGEPIISVYSADKPYKVYKSDYWFSDQWDPMSYGQEFDFSKTFFEQFAELQRKVPRVALTNVKSDNSDYCNSTYGNKNCYLIFGGDFNQDCIYGTLSMHNEDVVDCDFSNKNRLCYMMSDSINCYNCQFAFDSKNCTDCAFITDCTNCTECILSSNLHNKTYFINNKQYSKEEYFKEKKRLLSGDRNQQQLNLQNFLSLRSNRIVKDMHAISCENCTGDYMKNSQDCHMAFDVSDSQNIESVVFASKAKDCYNTDYLGDNAELCYNSVSTLGSYDIRWSHFIIESSNIEYSEMCMNSKDLFGCIGVRQKQYCVLNKQYSKEDFFKLREKIIDHMKQTAEWGLFFPKSLSCVGYNESTAQQHFPLTKDQALKLDHKWQDKDPTNRYQGPTINVPDRINDVTYEITKQILVCKDCQKNYRIINEELNFYRKMNIPVPKQCPDCRYKWRLSMRNPRKLWDRTCICTEKAHTNHSGTVCKKAIQTSYAPDRPEKVYCEECYLETVY